MKSPVLAILLLLTVTAGFSQTVKTRHRKPVASCRDLFIQSAIVLPALYKEKAFDSIQYYIRQQQQCCYIEYVFCLQLLLEMEQKTFSPRLVSDTGFYNLLEDYASNIRQLNKQYMDYYSSRHFNATWYDKQIFGLISSWAKDLLGRSYMDSTQTFLCHVLAGDIRHPNAVIRTEKIKYAALDTLLAKSAVVHRNSRAFNMAAGASLWMPGGNLGRLGNHPGFSFPVMGVRNKLNQLDWVCNLRFGRTPGTYTVSRQGALYQRDYYLGGYIGLDYTRYFLHTLHCETGIIAGAGYDEFDIGDTDRNDHSYDYLNPRWLSSFNYNLGLRFNYFFNPNLYIGLAAKYNFTNYCNPGGTPLDGNALSIDLLIGGNFTKY